MRNAIFFVIGAMMVHVIVGPSALPATERTITFSTGPVSAPTVAVLNGSTLNRLSSSGEGNFTGMDAGQDAVIAFAPAPVRTLQVRSHDPDRGAVSPASYTGHYGDLVQVTATPFAGQAISAWAYTGSSVEVPLEAPLPTEFQYPLTTDTDLSAYFRPIDRSRAPGVTVIVHGYDLGGGTVPAEWQYWMAASILNRATRGAAYRFHVGTRDGNQSPIYHIPVSEYGSTAAKVTAGGSAGTDHLSVIYDQDFTAGEQVILVNWGPVTGMRGYAEGVAHQVYALLMGGIKGGRSPFLSFTNGESRDGFRIPDQRIHLIGHSMGTVVISEIAQRLSVLAGVEVDHLTTLDPHDWDESGIPVDGHVMLPDIRPWSNAAFFENYYQTTKVVLTGPTGRPILGAHTINDPLNPWQVGTGGGTDLTAVTQATESHVLGNEYHSAVIWHYMGSIDYTQVGLTPAAYGKRIRPAWYPQDYVGFYGYERYNDRSPLSEPRLWRVHDGSLLREADDRAPTVASTRSETNGRSDIGTDPPTAIFDGVRLNDGVANNGSGLLPDFNSGMDSYRAGWLAGDAAIPWLPSDWQDGDGTLIEADGYGGQAAALGTTALVSDYYDHLMTGLTYIPPEAESLSFRLRQRGATPATTQVVLSVLGMNDEVSTSNPLSVASVPAEWTTYTWPIPASWRGVSGYFGFKLDYQSGTNPGTGIQLDDLSITPTPAGEQAAAEPAAPEGNG